jgi:hypothetical protein
MSSLPSSSSIPSMQVVGLSSVDPRQSAIQSMNTKAEMLNTLNQTGGIFRRRKCIGKSCRKMRGGFQTTSSSPGEITIPMPTPLYSDTLVGNQSSSGQTIANAILMTSSAENAKYDSLAASPIPIPPSQLKGGYRKFKTKKRVSKKRKFGRKSRKMGKKTGKKPKKN